MHMGTNPKQESYGASNQVSASRDQDKKPAAVTSKKVFDTERDDLADRLRYNPGGYPQVSTNAPRRKHHSDDDIELLHGPDSRIQQTTTISVYNESLGSN